MEYSIYGEKEGRLVVYFHGAPGSSSEGAVFDGAAKNAGLKVVCFDRFSTDYDRDRTAYYKQLSQQVSELLGEGETVDIIGFSIGAFVALKVSALLGDKVKNIHLISAAAPLSSGDYLDDMAGGFVFKLADRYPLAFYLLTQYQKALSFIAPKLLFGILFASAAGRDVKLAKDRGFKDYIIPILQTCFKANASGYMRDVTSYVQWNDDFKWCHAKTTNWHGTNDNWSPFNMAIELQKAIPGAVALESLEGMSHYSCLFEVAPKIMAQLSENKM